MHLDISPAIGYYVDYKMLKQLNYKNESQLSLSLSDFEASKSALYSVLPPKRSRRNLHRPAAIKQLCLRSFTSRLETITINQDTPIADQLQHRSGCNLRLHPSTGQ